MHVDDKDFEFCCRFWLMVKTFFFKREKTVNPGQVLGSTWFNLCIVFSMDYIFITLLIKLKILANLIKCIISE